MQIPTSLILLASTCSGTHHGPWNKEPALVLNWPKCWPPSIGLMLPVGEGSISTRVWGPLKGCEQRHAQQVYMY